MPACRAAIEKFTRATSFCDLFQVRKFGIGGKDSACICCFAFSDFARGFVWIAPPVFGYRSAQYRSAVGRNVHGHWEYYWPAHLTNTYGKAPETRGL
jgi:hypothetical protein